MALARKHAHELSDYGVTPARIHAFGVLTQKFAEESGRPRSIIVERKLALGMLPKLFAQVSELLARLDRLTSLLREEHAEFIQAYRASRRISRAAAARGRVGEKADPELAMAGVVIPGELPVFGIPYSVFRIPYGLRSAPRNIVQRPTLDRHRFGQLHALR